jgi:hypothetical protein
VKRRPQQGRGERRHRSHSRSNPGPGPTSVERDSGQKQDRTGHRRTEGHTARHITSHRIALQHAQVRLVRRTALQLRFQALTPWLCVYQDSTRLDNPQTSLWTVWIDDTHAAQDRIEISGPAQPCSSRSVAVPLRRSRFLAGVRKRILGKLTRRHAMHAVQCSHASHRRSCSTPSTSTRRTLARRPRCTCATSSTQMSKGRALAASGTLLPSSVCVASSVTCSAYVRSHHVRAR